MPYSLEGVNRQPHSQCEQSTKVDVKCQALRPSSTMFQNVVAIVSGGASGLGAATASYLVRNGARVVVADLHASQEQFMQMKSSIDTDTRLQFAPTDVTSEDDVTNALNVAEQEFGEQGMCCYYCDLIREEIHSYSYQAYYIHIIESSCIVLYQSSSECGCKLCRHSSSKENTLNQTK